MKTLGTVPRWAQLLIVRVCSDYGRTPARIRTWRNSRDSRSSGTTWHDARCISITAGTNPEEVRAVLLHELAHYLIGTKHHHDKAFWKRCWELHGRYGCLDVAWRCESWYKKKAITYAPKTLRDRYVPS
jgi:hypothetical protein